jgi:hypothetical protein
MSDSPPALPKLHAVLVGINEYKNNHPSPLKSAAQDAEKFGEFLGEKWKNSTIYSLRDDKATRDAIVEQLSGLQANHDVSRNDAIVFFFSGYAGTANDDEEQVGAICPTDYLDKGGISDHTLVKLFDQISMACGNNIVRDLSLIIIIKREANTCPRTLDRLSGLPVQFV